jgi:hypothetical protein
MRNTFDQWWEELKRASEHTGIPINLSDQEAYREFYDSQLSPMETLEQEASNGY